MEVTHTHLHCLADRVQHLHSAIWSILHRVEMRVVNILHIRFVCEFSSKLICLSVHINISGLVTHHSIC